VDLAGQALELSRAFNERGHQVWALRLLGEIAARRKPPEHDQARDYYQEALALAQELSMRPLLSHCYLGLDTLMPKSAIESRPMPNCPRPSSSIAPWT
jgi:hypothetical protein